MLLFSISIGPTRQTVLPPQNYNIFGNNVHGSSSPAYLVAEFRWHRGKTSLVFLREMKIEEAILYVLAERNGGLRTEQIAEIINRRRLHVRKDGKPVTSAQVYAVVMHYPDTFVKAEGRIMLMI